MEAHGALRLPPSRSVLQHRGYLVPFVNPRHAILPGNKRRLQHVCEPDEMNEREEKMVQLLYTHWYPWKCGGFLVFREGGQRPAAANG